MQETLIAKKAKFYVIDATKVARDSGMGGRINTIMQVCFFALSGVLPRDKAIESIKYSIKKTYGKKGEEVVAMNLKAVDNTLEHLHEVPVPNRANGAGPLLPPLVPDAPKFVNDVLGKITAGEGDELPVSAFPVDGTFPTGTAQYEKRNLALDIPVWDEKVCIQCLKCVAICPHATIRAKVYEPAALKGAPATFKSTDSRVPDSKGLKFTLQVAAEDCTGCALCVDVCPAKNKTEAKLKAINMRPQAPLRDAGARQLEFLPRPAGIRPAQGQDHPAPPAAAPAAAVRIQRRLRRLRRDALHQDAHAAFRRPRGHRQRHRLLLHLRRQPADHALCANKAGRGPTWCNSLFEDNAEFGLGFRVSIDKQKEFATELLKKLAPQIGDDLVNGIINADQTDEAGIYEQRERVAALKQKLAKLDPRRKRRLLLPLADKLVKRASGFSAATAGPTTSATAAWTTCWPAAATSTCWSWTRKFIPTPAGRCPSPRRAARWRSSPPAASRWARRTSA